MAKDMKFYCIFHCDLVYEAIKNGLIEWIVSKPNKEGNIKKDT